MEETGILKKLFSIAYRRRSPKPLPPTRPRFQFLPKYHFSAGLPAGVFDPDHDDPHSALEQVLEPLGFQLEKWTKEAVFFTRGKDWGDFSMKLIKVTLEFELPLVSPSSVIIGYGKAVLFDTGDLWTAARAIQSQLKDSLNEETSP